MKNLILGLTITLATSLSIANELAQALYDNACALSALHNKCGTQLGEIKTTKVSTFVFTDEIQTLEVQPMIGAAPKCLITITQDFSFVLADGLTKYQIEVLDL